MNGKHSIVTDIEKTCVKGHRIPIDEELGIILTALIEQSQKQSNEDNNSEGYVFIRYSGSRRAMPFQIKMNQFRHTYAVKMLNGGADILTLQELLAHASPEMTLRYIKFLDGTKRKEHEAVIKLLLVLYW